MVRDPELVTVNWCLEDWKEDYPLSMHVYSDLAVALSQNPGAYDIGH